MKYFKKIIGERIYLSPINMDDAELYTKWLNDIEVSESLGIYSRTVSLGAQKKYMENSAGKGHEFAIVALDGDGLLGNVSLGDIESINRTAKIGIFIGEAEMRGKGYGTEAIRLILDYGFKTLNLHNVKLEVFADNARAIACYKKVGFREIGRRREAKYKNGRYVDEVYMDILDSDFGSEK